MKRGDVSWVEFDTSIRSKVRETRPAIIISDDARKRDLVHVVW